MAKSAKQLTSAGVGNLSIDLNFIIEDTLLSRKGSSRNDYFAGREKYLATLFKTIPRASSSDTRPDLELDPDVLASLYTKPDAPFLGTPKYYIDQMSAFGALNSIVDKLRAFKRSSYFAELGSNFYGVEVKGSKAGVDVYTYKKGSKTQLAPQYEKDFEAGKIYRTSARTLSNRTLLSAYDTEPDSYSGVVSLANALAQTLGYLNDFRTGLEKNQQKSIEQNIKKGISQDLEQLKIYLDKAVRSKEKAEEPLIAKKIYNYLSTGDNLVKFHKTVTGNPPTDTKNIWTTLYNTRAVKQVRAKGEQLFLQYVRADFSKRAPAFTSYTAYLTSSFKYENTKVILRPNEIEFAYTNAYEKAVINKIQQSIAAAASGAFTENMAKIIQDVDIARLLGTLDDLMKLKAERELITDKIILDTSGSIPIGKIKLPKRTISRKSTGSAFQSRIGSILSLLSETRADTRVKPSMGDFITDDTITALTKREMLRRMPIGPVGGPPKSSRVLTYRTGRFVNSLQVMADMRTQNMQYYYNPNYWIHEATSRDPKNLIGSSLNSVTRSLFGKRFNLVKSSQSLE